MNIEKLKLTFNPANPARLSDWDKTAFMEAVEDVIDADAVLVVASGNIDVSPCLKISLTRDSDRYFI